MIARAISDVTVTGDALAGTLAAAGRSSGNPNIKVN